TRRVGGGGEKGVGGGVGGGRWGGAAGGGQDLPGGAGGAPPPLESPAPRRARAPPPPAGSTPPARPRRDTSVLSPPRSAPPYWSRDRRSGRRRASWPCAHRSKIEAPAISDGGTRTRGRAQERLHDPVAGVEVHAGLGVSEACLRHGAPFVLLARFGTWESAPVQWLDRGYTDLAWPHVRLPMVTARRAGRAGAQI